MRGNIIYIKANKKASNKCITSDAYLPRGLEPSTCESFNVQGTVERKSHKKINGSGANHKGKLNGKKKAIEKPLNF